MSRDFFTRPPSFETPHGRIGVRWILVAHVAVSAAFALIRSRKTVDLREANENAITHELEGVLRNELLGRDGDPSLDSDFFRDVTRGSEVENHNGEKIGKKPDLVFHPRRENRLWDRRQDALFAECKPVDKKHLLKDHYCAVGRDTSGIERFVIGDYAWAMREAMIIGYARDGFAIRPHLEDALNDPARRARLGDPTPLFDVGPLSGLGADPPLCRTTHRRNFKWKDGRKADPIDVYHSWQNCS